MYKISIIVPVYNVEDTLQNAFDSILNQSIGFENLEVIFVDDKSSDDSAKIIENFSNNYENVKSIYLEENSGFAGKPRNVGIENATADYLMFLDPDDIFLENACELLYNTITKNKLELVSGNYNINRDNKIIRNNWDILKLDDGEATEVQNIEENFNFLLTTPSVWSKIFKKEFILKENIEFLVGVPAQDLVFVSEALLKAKGIKFINKPVVEYIPRQSGDESVTSKKNKTILAGFIKSYEELYNILSEHNENYSWISPRNLYFWIKQFVLSDLSLKDKIDLLNMANPLFKEFIKSKNKLKPPKHLESFLKLIEQKDFLNASKLSEKLDIYYDENRIISKIKNSNILLLFYGLDIEIGGLAKATFNRANLFNQHGYNVTLLNLDKTKNIECITKHFNENHYLDKNIEIINIYEYYSLKNLINKDKSSFKPSIFNAEKIETPDGTLIYKYFYENNLIKEEHILNNYICIKQYDGEETLIQEDFYTNDGFKYLSISYNNYIKTFTLNDRSDKVKIKFKNFFEFSDYFVTEILLNYNKKAFLINENSGMIPNFNNINKELAYKIASIHTNPYSGEYHYGSPIRSDFHILENIYDLDYVVVLTEALKNDLIKEFNVNNIEAIPNILDMEESPHKNVNNHKFSIFARLSPEKNISDAINAMEIVKQKRDDIILEIYGRAITPSELIEEEHLKKLVNELNLENNVIFKGHSQNVSEEMSNSLATIFVSKFEGMGMVVLESMLNSTPVISYDIHYGPSDFIINNENGYLIEQYNIEKLAECMLELVENPTKSKEMGKLAYEKIKNKLDKDLIFSKWEEILKKSFINFREKEINNLNYITNLTILNEYINLEREKIRLYRVNHNLYMENKRLKRQDNSNKNNIKLKSRLLINTLKNKIK